jgi:hypothetical protein
MAAALGGSATIPPSNASSWSMSNDGGANPGSRDNETHCDYHRQNNMVLEEKSNLHLRQQPRVGKETNQVDRVTSNSAIFNK